jgi:hypothetical protein
MLEVLDGDIELLMDTYKVKLSYYAGRLCSCVGENNGMPKPECGCMQGFWYNNPVTAYGIRSNVDISDLSTTQGLITNVKAKFTIPKYYEEIEQSVYEILAHGDVLVVDNKYRRDTDVLRKGVRDTLFAFDVTEIVSVSQLSVGYQLGVDFSLEGTTINWIGTNAPANNSYYSVEFKCKEQFRVWDVGAKDRGTQDAELPRLVLCELRRYIQKSTGNPIDSYTTDQKLF